MFEILLISIFTFFAFYGLVHIITEIVAFIARKNVYDMIKSHTVITVKDRENDIEGIIRAAAWEQQRIANCGTVPEIYAVDLGSCDKTFEILQKLSLEYDFLTALRNDEYIEVFTNGEYGEIRRNN